MVPKGDYSQQKLIVGKYTAVNSTPFVYTEPLDTMIEVKGESFTGTSSMVANGTEPDINVASPTVVKIYETAKGPYVGFDRLGISADFQAWLEPFDTVAGSYGLRLYIYTDEADLSAGESQQRIYSMTLSNSDMYGNPYNFEGFFTQSKVFDISDINNITKIEIYMFQNGDFLDGNGNYISHGNVLQETGQFEPLPDNIFIKNVKLFIGYDENDFDKDTLILFTDDSLTYNNKNEDATTNKKKINVRWIHKREDGKFELLEQTDGVETMLNWYRYAYGQPAADKYSGVYWDRVNYEHTVEADTSEIIAALNTFYLLHPGTYHENNFVTGMQIPYANGHTNTMLSNSISLCSEWADEVLKYYGINEYIKQHGFLYLTTSSIRVQNQTWKEIFQSRMVYHTNNYTYTDSFTGKRQSGSGCLHPISFWTLLTTAYRFYWQAPEEFEKINMPADIFNGGPNANWAMYRGLSPYTQMSYSGSQVYANTDHSPFTISNNTSAMRNLLTEYANSFGEWGMVEDDYHRPDYRPVNADVYAYLYDQVQLFFQKMDDPTYTYSSDFFYYNFDPDITKQQEQIKVIGLVKSGTDMNGNPTYTPYYSNLITFENEQEVASQATIDAASALQIVCEDGSDSNYFIYDQNGRLNDDSEGRGKSRTMEIYYRGARIDQTTGVTKIEWHIPKDYSMMAVDENEHCATANNVTNFYEGTRKSYTSIERFGNNLRAGTANVIKTQQYYIKDYWAQEYSNNTVECIATIDGVEYTAVKEFQFGKAGTTGTNVTFVLSFEGNRNSLNLAGLTSNDETIVDIDDEPIIDSNDSTLTAPGVSDAFATINAKLYDAANKEINLSAIGATVTWGWKDDYNNPYMDYAASDDTYSAIVNLRSSVSSVPTKNYSILKATLTGWVSSNGTYDLVAYLPIPIKLNNEYKYISGTKEVIYDSQGTPNYSALPYQLYRTADDRVNTTWGANSPNRDAYGAGGSTFKYYHDVKQTKNGYTFQALNFYVNGGSDFCCVFAQDASTGNILWSQPILITQNQYDFAMLNQWDGNLTIDENNGTILSKMVGAGKKNSNNTFSGVLMGDVQQGTGNNMVRETGLYGFQEGVMTFQLKESGKAIFGASGHGQITIDGTKGTIESASFSSSIENERKGMKIDLDDGILNIIDKTQQDQGNRRLEILLQPTTPFFKVTSPRGTDLIHLGTDAYYLRSDNYVTDTSGLNLDLKNGRLDAFNFKLVSGKVVFDSTEGNHPYFYVRNSSDTNYLIYLGPNQNYIASNDYTANSGMIINLENSQIVGSDLFIQGTNRSSGQTFRFDASSSGNPITVGNWFKVAWSGKMECEEAVIKRAYIYDAHIQNGDGSGSNVNINENFTVNSSGDCTANNLTATGSGQIGPYSIGSDALTGNGVTLEKDKIKINGATLTGYGNGLGIDPALHCHGMGLFDKELGSSSSLFIGDTNIQEQHLTDLINFHNFLNGQPVVTTVASRDWVRENFAAKDHDHDGTYAPADHTHSGYAPADHGHGTCYGSTYNDDGLDHSHNVYVTVSSLRYKTEINSLKLNLDDFKPVQFKYNEVLLDHHHDDDRIHYGFIAEELEQVNPDLVIYNEEGQPDAVDYQSIIALCVKEIQELKKEINELKEKIKQ